MVFAELKNIYSPQISDLINYHPDDQDCFSFLLQISIGPKDQIGEELFDLEICTPKWLSKTYDKDEIIMSRHMLIVQEYNYDNLITFIKKYLDKCYGKDWKEVANKLSRFGYYEFENYIKCTP